MKKIRVRPLAAALCITGLSMTAMPVHSDINKAISGMFDGMVATSPSGKWETQTRGVISGGGVRVRTPIVEEQLINIQLPSIDASCGGIDLFGGSFSFVNSEQLTQIGRHIISNAKNYAFKLGLEVVSPKIAGLMQEIENTVRAMNELSMNSCEWAQGLVAPGARAIENRFGVDMGLTGQEGQVFDDFFNAFGRIGDGANAEQSVRSSGTTKDAYDEMVGNIFWQAMQRNNVGNWNWVGSTSSGEIMEMVQAFIGTVVVGEKGSADEEREVQTVTGQADLRTIVFGSPWGAESAYIKCNSYSSCDRPDKAGVNVKGMEQRMRDMLLGADGGVGLVHHFDAHMHDAAFTPPQEMRNMLTSLPFEFGARIARLAPINVAGAEYLVDQFAALLALEASVDLMRAQLRAARSVISTMDTPYKDDLIELVRDAERRLMDQRQEIQLNQSVESMEITYRMLIEQSDVPRHHMSGLTLPRAVGTR